MLQNAYRALIYEIKAIKENYKFISKNYFMHCNMWSTKFLLARFDQTKYLNQNVTILLIWCFLPNLRKINDKIVFICGKRMGKIIFLAEVFISQHIFFKKKYPGKLHQLSTSCALHKTMYKEHHMKRNSHGIWCSGHRTTLTCHIAYFFHCFCVCVCVWLLHSSGDFFQTIELY